MHTPNAFSAYPADITQHVIAAMTPRIEAEIKLVVEAVEAAKIEALKQALKKFATDDVANDPQPPSDPTPPVDPKPPTPPKPGKRRTSWDGMTAAERSAVVTQRWVPRKANAAAKVKQSATAVPNPAINIATAASPKVIRYGSICSGVEALSLAWEPLGGFEPVFFSEVEAFPSAVLAKRWPEVPNLGDFTQIDGKQWKGKLDALGVSLPCQSFSLAGKRKGARDARGAMFRPFLKLADEIAVPVVIMENVVGLRSDPAFRAILKGLSGSAVAGPVGRSGSHEGPSRRLAWTVLDSGTEQRRPRLFLVACSQSSGIDPRSLLPESEGFKPDREKAAPAPGKSSQGPVVWLNADTTPKWSSGRVGTLRAAGGSGGRSLVCVDGRVRDLMPEERERLMGWDGQHTAIEFKGTEKTLDRLRNRAIGNSLALPPVRAIGEKLKAALATANCANDNGQPSIMPPGEYSPNTPTLEKAMNVDLRLGDCLTQMATLPDASVDLIAADLPYGTTACKWDTRVDLDAFWTEVRRVLTPTGTVVLNSAGRFTADLMSSNPKWYKHSLVWAKTKKGQFFHAPFQHLCGHEDILVFSPAGACLRARNKMTYNPQGVIELAKERVFKKAKVSAGVYKAVTTKAAQRTQKQTDYPNSILYFASEGRNQHPTQKPVDLMEYLIATFSNPGDLVLDPTMGSGTTGVAARNLGRRFVGIEKLEKYFKVAQDRIAEAEARSEAQSESYAPMKSTRPKKRRCVSRDLIKVEQSDVRS